MNKPDVKKLVLLNLPYVFAFYFADKIAAVFRLAPGTAFIDKLTNGFAVFGTAFANPLPSFHPVDLLIGLIAGALLKLAVYVKGKNRKKFRQGEEYGSARWGKPEDIKPYMDPEFSNNAILTQTEFLTMNSRPKQPKYARNKNILVIGGSGSGKTAKSILISCGARLAPFDIAELRELMSYDEMELDTIGDRKTALFVIISDTDDTFNFVVAIMYSQLFNLLCDKADDVYNGRLPVHVRCLLDEFANIGQIPKFDKLIATIRSREISASIILQSQSQLKTIYKDAADTITGNCDCTLFLGGKEKSTLKEISEVLGKETIDLYNTSETRSNNNSYGLNYQKTGKELMSQDEIAVMDGGKCILQLRGVRPFLSNKFDITKHPKYRQLSDYNKRNAFDIEKYRQHKLVVKPDDTFDLYDMGEVEAD